MMAPAFYSNRSAVAFATLLVVLLALPVILKQLGLPKRTNLYNGISQTFGTNTSIDQTIYGGPVHSDVVLLGSSTMIAGFPPGSVDEYFSKHLGRPAVVKYLTMQYSGSDKQYLLLADYLAAHTTDLIVSALPWRTYTTKGPSHDINSILRFGEFSDDFSEVSDVDRMRIYSEMVVAGPRQLLNEVRPNQPFAEKFDDVKRSQERGIDGPFVTDSLTAPSSLEESCVIPVTSRSIRMLRDWNSAYDYAALFYRKIAELAKSRNTPIVLVNFPELTDYGSKDIPVNLSLNSAFRKDQKMIAASSADLFGNISNERYRNFFRDDVHLNANGSRLFDSIALPALYRLYRH